MDDVLWILNPNLYGVIVKKTFKAMPVPVYSKTFWVDVLDSYEKAGGKYLPPSFDHPIYVDFIPVEV